MGSNLHINSRLIEEARNIGHQKTKKAAVEDALSEYIQRHKQMNTVTLFNKINFEPAYNYKKQRKVK